MTTYYTEDHEWITVDGDVATVGITKYAAEQLGDVVFVEVPEAGASFAKGDDMAVVGNVVTERIHTVSGVVRTVTCVAVGS